MGAGAGGLATGAPICGTGDAGLAVYACGIFAGNLTAAFRISFAPAWSPVSRR